MQIHPLEPDWVEPLTSLYCRAVQEVPHCYPVAAADLESALAGALCGPPSDERLGDEIALVASDQGAPVGFVHFAIQRPKKPAESDRGVIRFLWYERGRRAAGQALLDAAHDSLRERGITEVEAFPQEHRYPFYHLKAAYLSERMDHVEALLALNGYTRFRGEVFLDWPDFEICASSASDPGLDVKLEWHDGRGTRPGLALQATQDGKNIGECVNLSGGEFSRAEEAQDWLFTTWLGISDDVQGKGLGKRLLDRALLEMRAIGYRHAAISTAWDNHRAFLFYSNCGYRLADWTYGFIRRLEPTA